MEEEIMSYLAGLMDGDGSFNLGKLNNASKSPLYFPVVQFGFQKKDIVEIFKDKFGGYIHYVNPKKDQRYKFDFYHWSMRSVKNVKPFIERLGKYLILKKARAEFLLEFCNKFEFTRGYELSKEKLFERESAYIKFRQMNDNRDFRGISTFERPNYNETNSLFWSYVAGIIESDGSFCVKKQKYQYGQRYLPVISIDMVDPLAIHYISTKINFGRVLANKVKACKNGICYRLALGKKEEIISFLNQIFPFLRVKKEQAKTLLEFCQKWKNTGYCKAGVPVDEIVFREECHQKIKQLNKYGVYKPSVIDSEALKLGNEGQAGNVQAERLNPMDSKECVIV